MPFEELPSVSEADNNEMNDGMTIVTDSMEKLQISHTEKVPSKGGLYHIKEADIMISIPNKTLSSKSKIVVVSRPASEYISTDPANILSEMITLLPHNTGFNQHVLIKFPMFKPNLHQDDQVELLYSTSVTDAEHNWVRLKQHGTSCKHSDDIFWFIDSEYCYLFVEHFCHFLLLKNSGKQEQEALKLYASVHAIWNKQGNNDLEIAVGFHCPKCNKINLKNQSDLGIYMTFTPMYIFRDGGPATISVDIPGVWSQIPKTMLKTISAATLMLQCNPEEDVYFRKFLFVLKEKEKEVPSEISCNVRISQQDHDPGDLPFITSLEKLKQTKTFVEATTNTDINDLATGNEVIVKKDNPTAKENDRKVKSNVEDGPNGTEPGLNGSKIRHNQSDSEHKIRGAKGGYPKETYIQNIQHIHFHSPTSFPRQSLGCPYQPKNVDCIFNSSVEKEESELREILDNDCKELLIVIAKSVGDLNGTVDRKNITGLVLLQVWQTRVQSKKCTWKKLYDLLLNLNCETAAQQLKVVYEKDKLISELEGLRHYLRLKDLAAKLVSYSIIGNSEKRMLIAMTDENEAVDHLVLELLIRRDHKYLALFHKVLYNDIYLKDFVPRLTLCPDELD